VVRLLKTAGWVFRLGTALLPPILVPVFFYLIAEDHLSFGGGEKDIILVLPAAIWAVLFSGMALLFWWKRLPSGRSLALAAVWATLIIALLGALLALLAPAFLGTS
jgi:hypothetical protein